MKSITLEDTETKVCVVIRNNITEINVGVRQGDELSFCLT
jgi:hypothetical protein